jgi:hypothetical protein
MAASGGDREQKIRETAYLIWMEEGCPSGRDYEHWVKACERVDLAVAIPDITPVKPAPAKPAKAKPVAAARPRKASPKR